jgi:hypothetical protein
MTSAPPHMKMNTVLEELKKPWSASRLTPAQKQYQADVATAKGFWKQTLNEYRNSQQRHTKPQKTKKTKQPIFPFLDLSPELRNKIYDICLDDEKAHRNPSIRRMARLPMGDGGSKQRPIYNTHQLRVLGIRSAVPTERQIAQDKARRKALNSVVQKRLKQAEKWKRGFTAGARELFEQYRLEHEMYSNRAKNKTNNEADDRSILQGGPSRERKRAVVVNPRRNLADDLPMLFLVDRELFQDTFYLFYSTTRGESMGQVDNQEPGLLLFLALLPGADHG